MAGVVAGAWREAAPLVPAEVAAAARQGAAPRRRRGSILAVSPATSGKSA